MDLLEKAFVLKTVKGYSRNLRKEISKKQKVYFEDLGVRNALIEKFAPLQLRDDIGRLWENFLFIERSKWLHNSQTRANQFFWRLQTGAELDYVEEYEGQLAGYEFKFGNKAAKAPAAWPALALAVEFPDNGCITWSNFQQKKWSGFAVPPFFGAKPPPGFGKTCFNTLPRVSISSSGAAASGRSNSPQRVRRVVGFRGRKPRQSGR